MIHELLEAGRVDLDYLIRYTNAPWLVHNEPGSPRHGLFDGLGIRRVDPHANPAGPLEATAMVR